jgi:hypothetical protein
MIVALVAILLLALLASPVNLDSSSLRQIAADRAAAERDIAQFHAAVARARARTWDLCPTCCKIECKCARSLDSDPSDL